MGNKNFICVFLQATDNTVTPQQPRITLQKKDEAGAKSINESLLNKLRPFRGSASAATLVALTGADALSGRKEDGIKFFMQLSIHPLQSCFGCAEIQQGFFSVF